MAKVYGGRWQLEGPLGQGGQSDVYRATDKSREFSGEYALKRVRNPERHARFRAEIDAIKRLSHPNIITLIDHSALNDGSIAEETQFMVMPIAQGGDLSQPARLSLYKHSIEAVLQVARQLAAALQAAHLAGIVHRDIKPQNVLFTGAGHEALITDFGICLIRENPRGTPTGEVVGPRAFMANELEDGGKLDVTPAADVYSLGKLIYYMYSGGVIIPRERLHEPQYSQVLDGTERARLLGALLRQMVSDLGSRIQTMGEVVSRIEQIEDWEKSATLVPITRDALSSIERMQRQALETARIQAENRVAREQEKRVLEDLSETFEDWVRGELQKAASQITASGILKCAVAEISSPSPSNIGYAYNRAFRVRGGVELKFSRPDDGRNHILQFLLCEDSGPLVSVTMSFGATKANLPQTAPARDANMALIPFYRNALPTRQANAPSAMGYLAKKTLVGKTRGRLQPPPRGRTRRTPPQMTQYKVALVTQSFELDVNQSVQFKASEWPGNVDTMRTAVTDAISSFLEFVESGGAVGT